MPRTSREAARGRAARVGARRSVRPRVAARDGRSSRSSHVERGQAGGARERVAAEGRHVREWRIVGERRRGCGVDRGTRRAAGRRRAPWRGRAGPGRTPPCWNAKSRPRAAEPGDHLVEDQERADLVAAASERGQERRVGGMRTPPSACTGSITTAAVSPSMPASARSSSTGQHRDAGKQGLERGRDSTALPPTESAPNVSPWKPSVERHQPGSSGVPCARS